MTAGLHGNAAFSSRLSAHRAETNFVSARFVSSGAGKSRCMGRFVPALFQFSMVSYQLPVDALPG
jgi:hypothetical protein